MKLTIRLMIFVLPSGADTAFGTSEYVECPVTRYCAELGFRYEKVKVDVGVNELLVSTRLDSGNVIAWEIQKLYLYTGLILPRWIGWQVTSS